MKYSVRGSGQRYLIGLVVVLWVVFEDLGLLGVLEVLDQVVEVEFFPPGLAVHEPDHRLVHLPSSRVAGNIHLLRQLNIEFPCT